MNNLDMPSNADWSNALWKLVENHWTMDEKQSVVYQLDFERDILDFGKQ